MVRTHRPSGGNSMHRTSQGRWPRSWWLGLTLIALSLGLVPFARAADKANASKGEKAKFDTVDGVSLHGTYYPSSKGRKAPTVLMLHKIGGSSGQDGWDDLAAALNGQGYAVLSFDFRGHGGSTEVDREFWNFAYNRSIRGFNPSKPKSTIDWKDFPSSYYPYLLNDIAAARAFLDRKNDSGECNTASLILIGAEDGATLGAYWMTAEYHRYRLTNNFPLKWETTPEGRDLHAVVWLSISSSLRNRSVYTGLRNSLQLAADKKVPMAFLYGEEDSRGKNVAATLFSALQKSTDKEALKLTAQFPIKKTKLSGSALLNKALDTQEIILTKYLAVVMDKKEPNEWVKRDLDETSFVWNFPSMALPVLAKDLKQKLLHPIPINHLGMAP
jgi:hypothetical protein